MNQSWLRDRMFPGSQNPIPNRDSRIWGTGFLIMSWIENPEIPGIGIRIWKPLKNPRNSGFFSLEI